MPRKKGSKKIVPDVYDTYLTGSSNYLEPGYDMLGDAKDPYTLKQGKIRKGKKKGA